MWIYNLAQNTNDSLIVSWKLQYVKDNKFYVGFTKDLKKRFDEHNKGIVSSTVFRRPLKLIYYEACLNETDATGLKRMEPVD